MAASFALGPLFLLLLIIGFTAWGAIALWRRALRKPSDGLSHCGQCGYAVEGLEKMSCPECGADFRKVGIVAPNRQVAMSMVAFAILWGTLLLPFAVIAYAILFRILAFNRFGRLEALIMLLLTWLIPFALGCWFLHRHRTRT